MWGPDRFDFRIVRELAGSPSQWNVKKSYTTVAKRLGVDEETVRNRLRRMRREGYLLGWRLIPNPALLGRNASVLLIEFRDSRAKEKALSELQNATGVVVIASFYEKRISVTMFHRYTDDELPAEAQKQDLRTQLFLRSLR